MHVFYKMENNMIASETNELIQPVRIVDEMKQSYLDYAMSVIVGRALPDVRDGLKPVHRRVLYSMYETGNDWNKAYKKSARVVGDVMGKYHPHGDSAIYDTIVRMAQPFSLRYMLVDGQGNFGSIDGDAPAAMRYTEIRMQKIAHDLLSDLDKETVDFVENYDGTEMMPSVLPSRIPNLLVNGSSGIAVGMATNIPPHNLNEIVTGCLRIIDNPETTIEQLLDDIPGPDLPTGAIINGKAGILQAYRTGRGRIRLRAKTEIIQHPKTNREHIIVHEIPYQLNKSRLIEKIALLVKDKKIEGISELRDESDKDGLRIVIEVKRNELAEVVLNNLYAQTQLQSVFGINMVALVENQPRLLNLKEILEYFLEHRREVVTRRTIYLLKKARERGHLLEGLAIALANIDEVIALIKDSETSMQAKQKLIDVAWLPGQVDQMLQEAGKDACKPYGLDEKYGFHEGKYHLSPFQAQAILDLRLHRLTGLEHEKLIEEYQLKVSQIANYQSILQEPEKLFNVVREELKAIQEEHVDPRRTEIIDSLEDLTDEDLISEETRVVTISHGGYAKTQPLSDYQAQRRGGVGKSATAVKDEDFVEHLLVASTHAEILCFTNLGKVYWLKVFHIPVAGRNSRGRPMVNLLPLDEGERVTSILPVEEYTAGHYIIMATRNGVIKKTALTDFSRQRSTGLRALGLEEGDVLVATSISKGDDDIMLVSSAGKAVRFHESNVRAMGRTAKGVRGIRLGDDHDVISLIIPKEQGTLLTVSENGYGKKTLLEEFAAKGRGNKGMIAMKTSDRNGQLIDAVQVDPSNELMLITDQGTMVRIPTDEIPQLGRNTQGVRVIRLRNQEKLIGLEKIDISEVISEECPEEDE
jgi:DNA gyrase subunit A